MKSGGHFWEGMSGLCHPAGPRVTISFYLPVSDRIANNYTLRLYLPKPGIFLLKPFPMQVSIHPLPTDAFTVSSAEYTCVHLPLHMVKATFVGGHLLQLRDNGEILVHVNITKLF